MDKLDALWKRRAALFGIPDTLVTKAAFLCGANVAVAIIVEHLGKEEDVISATLALCNKIHDFADDALADRVALPTKKEIN